MGDTRYRQAYEKVRDAPNRVAALQRLADEEVVAALAWASKEADPLFANFLATEAMNRMVRGRRVIEHVSEGILTLDREGRILAVNPAAERILGSLQVEIAGKPLEDVIAFPGTGTAWVLAPLRGGNGSTRPAVAIRTIGGRAITASVTGIPITVDEDVTGEVVEIRLVSPAHKTGSTEANGAR